MVLTVFVNVSSIVLPFLLSIFFICDWAKLAKGSQEERPVLVEEQSSVRERSAHSSFQDCGA